MLQPVVGLKHTVILAHQSHGAAAVLDREMPILCATLEQDRPWCDQGGQVRHIKFAGQSRNKITDAMSYWHQRITIFIQVPADDGEFEPWIDGSGPQGQLSAAGDPHQADAVWVDLRHVHRKSRLRLKSWIRIEASVVPKKIASVAAA